MMLPNRLARKYPEYQFSWGWAWLFPAHNPCRDPRTGAIVRYRVHEVNVQRAIKHARHKLGISVLPHELRHGYASHCLELGTNPRAIQQAMGHKSLETTMGYLHAEALSVDSPLDGFGYLNRVLVRPQVHQLLEANNSRDERTTAPSALALGRTIGDQVKPLNGSSRLNAFQVIGLDNRNRVAAFIRNPREICALGRPVGNIGVP